MKRFFAIVLSLVLAVGFIWGSPVKAYAAYTINNISVSYDDINGGSNYAYIGYRTGAFRDSRDLSFENQPGGDGSNVTYDSAEIMSGTDAPSTPVDENSNFQAGTTYFIVYTVKPYDPTNSSFSLSVTLTGTDWNILAGSNTVSQIKIWKEIIVSPTPPPAPTPENPPSNEKAEPVTSLKTISYIPKTLISWEEIASEFPVISKDKLDKADKSEDALLLINIVGKDDQTIPAAAALAMDKSSITGLHVFIGEGDAVTFFNDLPYDKYSEKKFNHNDTITETSRTIDFTDKGALNATVLLHTLIAPEKMGTIYKVVSDKEIALGKVKANANGAICFAISELATYAIKY